MVIEGVEVRTLSYEVSITLTCLYPMELTVTSSDLTIQYIPISAATVMKGDLSDGFSMALSGGTNGRPVALGALLVVSIEWAVKGMRNISFSIKKCGVTHGEQTINVVKDYCFSEALGGSRGRDPENQSLRTFSYRTFAVDKKNAADAALRGGISQFITCTIHLCTDCTPPTTCPKKEWEIPYVYTVNGIQQDGI